MKWLRGASLELKDVIRSDAKSPKSALRASEGKLQEFHRISKELNMLLWGGGAER